MVSTLRFWSFAQVHVVPENFISFCKSFVGLKCFSSVYGYIHACLLAMHLKVEMQSFFEKECGSKNIMPDLSLKTNIVHLERTKERKKHPNQHSSSKGDSLKVTMKG